MFSTRSGAAKLALGVVIGLVAIKVTVAVLGGSISIAAQAVDSFLDLFAISVTIFAVAMASMPADEGHPFGHGKVEGVAAALQAGLIFTAAGLIIYAAIRRIITGTTVELTEAGMLVMLVSIIASVFLSRHLRKVAQVSGSLALEASARNIAVDVYSAAGVLAAMAVIRFSGLSIFDPIVALGVAVFILKAAYDVLKKSVSELVDVRLPRAEEDEIISTIMEHSGQLVGFHAVRTRKAGTQRFIDLHLMMPKNVSLEKAHEMCDHLEQDIKSRLQESSVTIHVEPCDKECEPCNVFPCSLREDIDIMSDHMWRLPHRD